jgi:hypothetical protein
MKSLDSTKSWWRTMAVAAAGAMLTSLGMAQPPAPAAANPPATEKTAANKPVMLKIDRPEPVGRKSTLVVTSSNREVTVTKSAGVPPAEKKTYEAGSLRADREVLAVGKSGRATKLRLGIQSLKYTDTENTEPRELLSGGKEVIAELRDGVTTFTMAGKPVTAALDQALQSFGLVYDGPGSDVIFNTKVPRALGEVWDVNLREVAKLDAYQNFSFDLNASSGKVRLARIERVGGIECYIVTGEMTLIPTGMAGQDGADLTGSVVKFATTIPVPVDPASPELGGRTDDETVFAIRFKTADGSNSRIDVTTKAVRDEEIRDPAPAGR